MLFRTPLIPGFNDDKENIEATASFIKNELGLSPSEHLELLAYNNLGEDKYLRLGFSEPQRHARQSDKYLDELEELVMSF
jgi:pyruvate formate lyase activating enzyme